MLTLLTAPLTLALAIVLGLLAHELAHATVLRLGRVECTVSVLPARSTGLLVGLRGRQWAVVEPTLTGRESPWVLRVAALAPLTLWIPVLAAGAAGLPFDRVPLVVFTIGWLACALPSPRDFSVAFYAHRLIDETAASTGSD